MTDEAVANKHRGEISVTLDGVAYVMRPDFEAVAAIDETLGSVIALTKRAVGDPASLSLTELAVVVTEGIRAHGRANKTSEAHSGVDKIKKLIFASGIPNVVPSVCQFLAQSVTGGVSGND